MAPRGHRDEHHDRRAGAGKARRRVGVAAGCDAAPARTGRAAAPRRPAPIGITIIRCTCGEMPSWASHAPNRPAEKKPMLQKACARFMMRRPTRCSARSASSVDDHLDAADREARRDQQEEQAPPGSGRCTAIGIEHRKQRDGTEQGTAEADALEQRARRRSAKSACRAACRSARARARPPATPIACWISGRRGKMLPMQNE